MTEQLLPPPVTISPVVARLVVEPFLHYGSDRIYNTLTDRSLLAGEPGFAELHAARDSQESLEAVHPGLTNDLVSNGWLVEQAPDLSSRFRLKYVSLEASTVCNQGCYFCPVSVDRRENHAMTMEFYESILQQLSKYKETIDGVSMIHYNEPTADRRFLEQVKMIKQYGLSPAVLTNATGLTPDRVDAILEMGGLRYLSINLSTLDRERYKTERGGDHLPLVLRNLEYVKDKRLAPEMVIAVLGGGDATHQRDFEEIRDLFAGSLFEVGKWEVMDRAGSVPVGLRPASSDKRLAGCEQTGSRPVQWVHINPMGQAVLCCQDYHDQYVIGDLHEQTLDEVLSGPKMSLYRRWVYGMEEAPDDFICRRCIYALTCE